MTKNKKSSKRLTGKGLVTAETLNDPFECPFRNDKERFRYMKENYGHMSIAEQFATFYGEKCSDSLCKNKSLNNPVTLAVGMTYTGVVQEISKNGITFTVPGAKEEIISKENFSDCMDAVSNYLLNHNNELLFTVMEKRDGRFYVSVLAGYYNSWQRQIERAIEQRAAIQVHIDSLIRGGYMCHTDIWTISELTGKTYTLPVFIPGSNIVLNVENDFERWVGQDVEAVPQRFTQYRQFGRPAETSLMASRKLGLKIIGMKNMYDIYNRAQLLKKLNGDKECDPAVFDGVVTGIINSNMKRGVFIELPDKYITGLMPVSAGNLLNYKPGDSVKVYIKEFECIEGKDPFYIDKRSIIRACNIRPVFAKA